MQPQKGSATIVAFIVLLLTFGGAVWYFKSFSLVSMRAEQPQSMEANKSQPSKETKSMVVQTESLAGVDADNNGVWDYIDKHINTTYPKDEKLRVGLRQYARAIQKGILSAHDKKLSLQYATESDRAQECVAFLRPDDFNVVLGEMDAQMLNTIMRSKEFLVWSEQSAGEVFSSASYSERGKSCIAE